jgi:hypothetical protein
MGKYLTARETAELIRYSKAHVTNQWPEIFQGKVKVYKPNPRKLLFRAADVEKWMESKAVN